MPAYAATALAVSLATWIVGFGASARASTTPPSANPAFLGTWVNTHPSTSEIIQVVIGRGASGGLSVDLFGRCQPTNCEWGTTPATTYGSSVAAATGNNFSINIDQGFARRVDFGHLTRSRTGALKLTLREFHTYVDGSGRHNITFSETLVPGSPQSTSATATAASDYPAGDPPAPNPALVGTWKNIQPNSKGMTEFDISNSGGTLQVHAFGSCTPTACDVGTTDAIVYANSKNVATTIQGNTFLAPYSVGLGKLLFIGAYAGRSDRLTVAEYTEFTDGSGRSNFLTTETFYRAG
jgi:hypothetical protein